MTRTIFASTAGRVLLATLLAAGCTTHEPELAEVTGLVTLDAEPLSGAVVTFQPSGPGRLSSGVTDEAGAYRLQFNSDREGALPGPHTVRISTARMVWNEERGDEFPMPERVPPKYNKASELTADVRSGRNDFDFRLESAKPQRGRVGNSTGNGPK